MTENLENVKCRRIDTQDEILLLDASVTVSLQFELETETPGTVTIIGVEYNITTPDVENCETIRAKQMFKIQGFLV